MLKMRQKCFESFDVKGCLSFYQDPPKLCEENRYSPEKRCPSICLQKKSLATFPTTAKVPSVPFVLRCEVRRKKVCFDFKMPRAVGTRPRTALSFAGCFSVAGLPFSCTPMLSNSDCHGRQLLSCFSTVAKIAFVLFFFFQKCRSIIG